MEMDFRRIFDFFTLGHN